MMNFFNKFVSSILIGDFNLPNFYWKEYTFPSYPQINLKIRLLKIHVKH